VHVNSLGEDRVVDEHSPPGTIGTTGNRMELEACIEGLERAPSVPCFHEVPRVVVRTDSKYVAGNYKTAMWGWQRSGWTDPKGRPIANADLWKRFVRTVRKVRKPFDIHWVKGHRKGREKDLYNVRADQLAKESARSPLSRRVYRSSVRRKIGPTKTKQGSVNVYGQRMIIYVVEMLWMPVHKTWRYRYEVASEESRDYHNTDWIDSNKQMRDGHYYEVQVNDDMGHPQVLEVIREVGAEDAQVGGQP
jgi:ribonuclease HI